MDRLPETCTEICATLPLFAGYDLEAPEMEAVAKHLERCQGCREACDRARRAREVLGTLRSDPGPRGESGPDLWGGIRSQLITEGLLKSGPRVARPFTSPRWWVGSAAAAAAVLLLSLGALRDFGAGPTTDQPAGAPAAGPGPVASADLTNTPEQDLARVKTPAAESGPARIPAEVSLVGHGTTPGRRNPVPVVPANQPARSLGKLRRLEPGELGLYEQALRDARLIPIQIRSGGSANRRRRLSGIR